MKTHFITTLLAVCGLVLGNGSLIAQEKPAPPPETVKPAEIKGDEGEHPRSKRPEGEQPRQNREGDRERGGPERRGPQPEMKPTPFIGVFTRPLTDDVRAQTGLAAGFGLIVEEVMPDSPAQKAGLQQHDVLVLLGDQRLVNQDQLSALVRSEKKDADITFTLKRAGAEQKVTVKVGEKMMPVAFDREIPRTGFAPFDSMFSGRDGERFGHEMREQAEKFRDGMKQFQERMQDWSRGPKDHDAPQPPQSGRESDRGPGPGSPSRRPQGRPLDEGEPGRPQGDARSSSSSSNHFQRNVVRRDDSGEYSLSDNNGAKIFTVKPTSGEEQTFIVNTEEQRKAVPEHLRAKLKELENVDGRVKPDASPPADTPKPGI